MALAIAAFAGCGAPAVGLRPAYVLRPGEQPSLIDPERYPARWIGLVDSVQPTLEWEGFPRAKDGPHRKQRIGNVTYDLRIWRLHRGTDPDQVVLGDLVYSREGLTEPQHRLEEPLLADTQYAWTIRARYELDGMPRATPWSGPADRARLPIEPNPRRYWFMTPFR